jgi:hypothetical protein
MSYESTRIQDRFGIYAVGCNTLVYVVNCQGSISHLEETEWISIAEWTSIFTQSTIKDHPIINHTDINVKVD